MSKKDENSGQTIPGADTDITMQDVDTKKKTKRKRTPKPSSTLSSFTIRNPQWSYMHLSLISSASTLDDLTAHMFLRAALSQFLGLHGTAIPIDILKVDQQDVWIRVPREDASAIVIAVGGWVGKGGEGWRVKHSACWGPDFGANTGMDLFDT